MKSMLGNIPLSDFQRLRDDLEQKIAGENGKEWFEELKRFVRKETVWVKNPDTDSHILTIDRTTPFNPVAFLGEGWKIEEQDKRSLLVTEIDFSKVTFETCLNPVEGWITGEGKLLRHARAGHILSDAKIGQDLYEEEGQKTLEYLYKEKGVTWFELLGTVLRHPSGRLSALCLYRVDGCWCRDYAWLDDRRDADDLSLVLNKYSGF